MTIVNKYKMVIVLLINNTINMEQLKINGNMMEKTTNINMEQLRKRDFKTDKIAIEIQTILNKCILSKIEKNGDCIHEYNYKFEGFSMSLVLKNSISKIQIKVKETIMFNIEIHSDYISFSIKNFNILTYSYYVKRWSIDERFFHKTKQDIVKKSILKFLSYIQQLPDYLKNDFLVFYNNYIDLNKNNYNDKLQEIIESFLKNIINPIIKLIDNNNKKPPQHSIKNGNFNIHFNPSFVRNPDIIQDPFLNQLVINPNIQSTIQSGLMIPQSGTNVIINTQYLNNIKTNHTTNNTTNPLIMINTNTSQKTDSLQSQQNLMADQRIKEKEEKDKEIQEKDKEKQENYRKLNLTNLSFNSQDPKNIHNRNYLSSYQNMTFSDYCNVYYGQKETIESNDRTIKKSTGTFNRKNDDGKNEDSEFPFHQKKRLKITDGSNINQTQININQSIQNNRLIHHTNNYPNNGCINSNPQQNIIQDNQRQSSLNDIINEVNQKYYL